MCELCKLFDDLFYWNWFEHGNEHSWNDEVLPFYLVVNMEKYLMVIRYRHIALDKLGIYFGLNTPYEKQFT